jgi:hypothetical protein
MSSIHLNEIHVNCNLLQANGRHLVDVCTAPQPCRAGLQNFLSGQVGVRSRTLWELHGIILFYFCFFFILQKATLHRTGAYLLHVSERHFNLPQARPHDPSSRIFKETSRSVNWKHNVYVR